MNEADLTTVIAVGQPNDVMTMIAALTSSDPCVVAAIDHLAVLVRLADPEAMEAAKIQMKLSDVALNGKYEYLNGRNTSGMRISGHLRTMKLCFIAAMRGRDRSLPTSDA